VCAYEKPHNPGGKARNIRSALKNLLKDAFERGLVTGHDFSHAKKDSKTKIRLQPLQMAKSRSAPEEKHEVSGHGSRAY
jgi:hypothetical protein